MQGLFSGMAQRLSSMLANTAGEGLTVKELTEDFLISDEMERVLSRTGGIEPAPIEHTNHYPIDEALPDSRWVTRGRSHLRPGSVVDNWLNFYPSSGPAMCCSTLLVISLSGRNASGSGHLKFEDALERIILHAQGVCEGPTKNIGFLTDSWGAKDYQKWAVNLERIKARGVNFEAYLLGEMGRCSALEV